MPSLESNGHRVGHRHPDLKGHTLNGFMVRISSIYVFIGHIGRNIECNILSEASISWLNPMLWMQMMGICRRRGAVQTQKSDCCCNCLRQLSNNCLKVVLSSSILS